MASKQQKIPEHILAVAVQTIKHLEQLAVECTVKGDIECLQLLLKSGLSVNTRCRSQPESPTLLHLAAGNDCTPIVLLLLQLGADTSVVVGPGLTPLHIAAGYGHVSTVRAMLKAGCPVNVVDSSGLSVLHYAAQGGNAKAIREVVSTGCDINATSSMMLPLGLHYMWQQ